MLSLMYYKDSRVKPLKKLKLKIIFLKKYVSWLKLVTIKSYKQKI
jgi:hypothetical protein